MEKSVTLLLMTRKGLATLRTALEIHRGLIAKVVVGSDKQTQNDYAENIFAMCREYDVECVPHRKGLQICTNYAIAVSWRWMIPYDRTQLIVFHDSLLPRYRGFNPLVSSLINEEPEIGVSAFFASEEYDRGDVIGIETVKIEYPIKIREAIEVISGCYAKLVDKILENIQSGAPFKTSTQDEKQASYSLWRDNEDYRIDWSKTATEIVRFVHATGYPYMGSLSVLNGRPVRILDVRELDDVRIENRTPGKTIFLSEGKPVVVCGSGLVMIDEMVDDENRKNLLPLSSLRSRFS